MDFAIEVGRLRKVFGKGNLAFEALAGIDLQVPVGEFMMLSGPSGSGKTTLLSILGCVLTATSGTYRLFGQEVVQADEARLAEWRLSYVGFIFQGHNLIASISAVENVALMFELRGASRWDALQKSRALLQEVGLGGKFASLPRELSGGQRQRVAIARALAGNPPLILADEPTAALDAANGLKVTELLRDLARAHQRTVLVVTHDPRIYHLADRIVSMEDGRIISSNKEGS